jgi:hypothetical protein
MVKYMQGSKLVKVREINLFIMSSVFEAFSFYQGSGYLLKKLSRVKAGQS